MGYSAKVLCDSVSPNGHRLTTMEVTFPRIVLAEFNTHRVFSRNSASSRAIPVEKMLKRIQDDPFVPTYWGKNQKGMQADEELSEADKYEARYAWMSARDKAVTHAKILTSLGVHKQLTNRLLEPFMWHTVIVTATEWENFFALRTHKDSQPEIREIAMLMQEVYGSSKPQPIGYGEWHRPLIDQETWESLRGNPKADDWEFWNKVSSGRCARVSYLTHDGKRDVDEDVKLCERLIASGHMSPLEHVATPARDYGTSNFKGWTQYRKHMPNEAVWKKEG